MKIFVALFILFGALPSFAASAPDLPPNACYSGCTSRMEDVLAKFNSTEHTIPLKPAVYSGECHYLSSSYDPDYTHYAVVMIDHSETQKPYFSTIFGFFLPNNEFASWSLETGRKEMSEVWKNDGANILEGHNASRVEVYRDDGGLSSVYWMRYDSHTETMYYITYLAGVQIKAFCELHKNR